MTLHEIAVAMEDKDSIFYTDGDGDIVEACIESVTDDGNIIIVTWHGTIHRVSPEELSI